MSQFRINAKHFSLTYPKCPLSKENVLSQLQLLFQNGFIRYCLAQEKHQDGSLHLHGYLEFVTKKNIKNPRAFDVVENGTTYHPNVQACKDRANWFAYLQKEDSSPLTNISPEDLVDIWTAVVAEKDPDVALNLIAKKEPKRLINNWNNINNYLEAKRRKLNEPKAYSPSFTLQSFIVPPLVQRWVSQIGRGLDRCWLLFLIGPPNIGKTQLMRSFGPHIYVRGFWALEPFLSSSNAQYVILDDVLLNQELLLPSRPILLGMEGGTYLTDKYTKKIFIDTGGKPCVIISNSSDLHLKMSQSPEWTKQFHVCDVTSELFETDSK